MKKILIILALCMPFFTACDIYEFKSKPKKTSEAQQVSVVNPETDVLVAEADIILPVE